MKWNFSFLVLIFLVSSLVTNTWSQKANHWISVEFPDTMYYAENTQHFVRGNVMVTNISNQTLKIQQEVNVPNGYNLVTNNGQTYELAPGKSFLASVTISKNKSAPAGASEGSLKFNILNLMTNVLIPFTISNKEFKELRVIQGKSQFEITPENRKVQLSLRIRNLGNTTYTFSINFVNKYLNLNKKINLAIPALKDTIVNYEYTVPKMLVNQLESQKIIASVGTENDFITFGFTLSRTKNSNQQHKSAYPQIPVTFESGAYLIGNQIQAYWGLGADIQFNSNNFLGLEYRSKMYGIQGLQNDYFSLLFRHKQLELNVGQLSESRHIMAFGLGAQATYRPGDSTMFNIKYVSNLNSINNQYKNENISFQSEIPIKKMMWATYLMGNADPITKLHSFIFENNLAVVSKPHLNLALKLGAGYERDLAHDIKTPVSMALGYHFRYTSDKWYILSQLDGNGNNFPGMYKGWRNLSNSVSYRFDNWLTTKLYFNKNYTRQSFFMDSTYYNNQLMYNITNYGLQSEFNFKNATFMAGYGRESSFGDFYNSAIPEYSSIMGGMAWQIAKNFRWQWNAAYNLIRNSGVRADFYNIQTSLASKYFGLNAYYMLRPVISGEAGINFLDGTRSSYNISPYLNFNLFYSKIKGRIQYSYYGSNYNDSKNNTQTLLGSLVYNEPKKGLFISLSGNYYLASTNGIPFLATFSLRKTINVPVITKRKYYDINVQLFNDKNGNLIFDNGDSALQDVTCALNSKNFRSNEKGAVKYGNVEKGQYALDFTKMNYIDGLIPVQGFKQNLQVEKQINLMVPFNKGKEITGFVHFIKDSLSSSTFTVDQLKVSAIDTAGNTFICFTDVTGEFKLSLPAGNYVISLNPDAFDENFKPITMAFNIDLLHNDKQELAFYIKQKARRINKVKAEL